MADLPASASTGAHRGLTGNGLALASRGVVVAVVVVVVAAVRCLTVANATDTTTGLSARQNAACQPSTGKWSRHRHYELSLSSLGGDIVECGSGRSVLRANATPTTPVRQSGELELI
ncbi:hypothetical protein B2J93_2493 [Marssonina coronariae]|uniref:Uncharacterized protein n=1 Tax=Diplocarpon coronariae TaxID=2795749 RepID=A0A218ZG53_9HELO|nr:hypothetical protein B2J93_2493 [Marssonina coronariae]